MKYKYSFKNVVLVIFGFVLIFAGNFAKAENSESAPIWNCVNLLDSQTKSDLIGHEKFFANTFQLPSEYELASENEKKQMVNLWINELLGNGRGKGTAAAAYLGIVKATEAANALEKRIVTGSGRIRWVCARSLGQIGEKSSISALINMLDNGNIDTRIYARVSLAEITGIYFGDDKGKWESWQGGETSQLCISTECKIDKAGSKILDIRKAFSKDKLDFCLLDIYGRVVDSQDYKNIPVLII